MILYQLTEHMTQRDVTFLDPRCQGGRHDKRVVNQSGERASRSAGPGYGDEPAVTSRRDAFQDIGRVPARTDANGNIALSTMSSNLAGEELFLPLVIRNAGSGGDIRRQGDRGERHAVAPIAAHKFSGDMGGIRGASAVSEEQNFVTVVEGGCDELCDLHDAVGILACKLLFDVGTACKGVQHNCLHG